MKECFQHKRFSGETAKLIEIADSIITDYAGQGYDLTLRQLYYQFVAKALIENSERSYKRIGSIINDARLAGLIDWSSIKDRTRSNKVITTRTSPTQILRDAAASYCQNIWDTQPNYVEVWVEKEALGQVIGRAANAYYVPWMSCKGYVSQSAMYEAAMRFIGDSQGRPSYLIHLGDHDPSGIDMTRDIRERFKMFGADVEVRRIALNMDQVEEYSPPPNPAKMSDSRVGNYIHNFGNSSWELDALKPEVLADLIETEIESLLDEDAYEESKGLERRYQAKLRELAEGFVE